jgi:hypothetical protein
MEIFGSGRKRNRFPAFLSHAVQTKTGPALFQFEINAGPVNWMSDRYLRRISFLTDVTPFTPRAISVALLMSA